MTDIQKEHNWLITGSLLVLATLGLAFALHYTRLVMMPFVLAVFIVTLVSPLLDFQVLKLKIPRSLAVAVSILVVIVIVAAMCLLILQAVNMIIAAVGRYSDSFANLAERAVEKVNSWGIELDQSKIISDLRNKVPGVVTDTLGTVFGLASGVFFVFIFVIFLLAGRNPHVVHSGMYAEIDQKVRRYIATKVGISAFTGVLVWISLSLLGLQLSPIFGIIAFCLNFIPSIGSIISTFLPVPIAVAQFQNFWMVILVVAIPGIIQNVIGNFVEPKLMGKGLNLHPVTVLLALSFWGLLWGIAGMFLAVPVTAVIRIVLMEFDALKPVANLLAGQLPGSLKK